MSRKERLEQMGDRAKNFTNVFLKNFGEELNDDKLRELTEPFGKIISARVSVPRFSGQTVCRAKSVKKSSENIRRKEAGVIFFGAKSMLKD